MEVKLSTTEQHTDTDEIQDQFMMPQPDFSGEQQLLVL